MGITIDRGRLGLHATRYGVDSVQINGLKFSEYSFTPVTKSYELVTVATDETLTNWQKVA